MGDPAARAVWEQPVNIVSGESIAQSSHFRLSFEVNFRVDYIGTMDYIADIPVALREIHTLQEASCARQDKLWTTLRKRLQRSERTIGDDSANEGDTTVDDDRTDDDVGEDYILESSILDNLRNMEDGATSTGCRSGQSRRLC